MKTDVKKHFRWLFKWFNRQFLVALLALALLPALVVSQAQAATTVEISSGDQLLSLLNDSGDYSNYDFIITKDITIDASDLLNSAPLTKLYNCSLVGDKENPASLSGNPTGNPSAGTPVGSVTITITNKSGITSRGLFNKLENTTLANICFVFEGGVRGNALTAELINCTVTNVNITIGGSIDFISMQSIDGVSSEYFASPAFGRIISSSVDGMNIVVEGQVGATAISPNLLYASGFANTAQSDGSTTGLKLENINITVRGGVFAYSDRESTACGFLNNLYLYNNSGVIRNNKITVGTAASPASIVVKNHKTSSNVQECFAAGFIGYVYTSVDNAGGVLSNNGVVVRGDIMQDGDAVVEKHSLSSAAGFIAGIVTSASNFRIDITGNSVTVGGAVKCTGTGRNYASGGMTYLSDSVAGYVGNNSVKAGSIAAVSLDRGTNTGINNDQAFAQGFVYATSPSLIFVANSVSVTNSITSENQGLSSSVPSISPSSHASGFGYALYKSERNTVLVGGDIQASSHAAANAAGFTCNLAGTSTSDTVNVKGSIQATAESLWAMSAGFASCAIGSSSSSKVDIGGNVRAISGGDSAFAGGFVAHGYTTADSNTLYESNSVYVAGDVIAHSADNTAYSGGFVALAQSRLGNNLKITDSIYRGGGAIAATSDSIQLSARAVCGGFAGALEGVEIQNCAVYAEEGVYATAHNPQKGSFAAITDSVTILERCTLLTKFSMFGAGVPRGYFVGQHGGTANDTYLVTVDGQSRIANTLNYNSDSEQWDMAEHSTSSGTTPGGLPSFSSSYRMLGLATVLNTNQVAPGFDYLLNYNEFTGLLSWLETPDFLSGRFTSGALSSYPVRVSTVMSTTPHAALISEEGIVYDIMGIQHVLPILTFDVVFDSRGGSAVASLADVSLNSTISQPQDPTREGYAFEGWYKEEACTNAWVFASDIIIQNTTLYAKWTLVEDPVVVVPPPDVFVPPSVTTYTVRFIDHDGTVLATRTVAGGGNAVPPPAPTREGYTFVMWNGSYTNVWANVAIHALYRVAGADFAGDEENGGESISSDQTEGTNPGTAVSPPGSGDPSGPSGSSDANDGFVLSLDNSQNKGPLGIRGSLETWSLLSLMLGLLGFVLALMRLIVLVVKERQKTKRDRSRTGRSNSPASNNPEPASVLINGVNPVEYKRKGARAVVTLISIMFGIVPLVVFWALEDQKLPMELVNDFTVWVALAFFIQIALLCASIPWGKKEQPARRALAPIVVNLVR